MVESCSTSLPGGDQVDGSPPAASNTKYSCLETPGRSELFVNFGRFFEKSWIFHALVDIFGILPVSSMSMLKRMREGLLLYRLLDEVLRDMIDIREVKKWRKFESFFKSITS